jgi:hypothetical protein
VRLGLGPWKDRAGSIGTELLYGWDEMDMTNEKEWGRVTRLGLEELTEWSRGSVISISKELSWEPGSRILCSGVSMVGDMLISKSNTEIRS